MCSNYFPRKWMRKFFSCQYSSYRCVWFLWRKDPSRSLHDLAFHHIEIHHAPFNSAVIRCSLQDRNRSCWSPESKSSSSVHPFVLETSPERERGACLSATTSGITSCSSMAKQNSLPAAGNDRHCWDTQNWDKPCSVLTSGLHQWVTAVP